MRNPKATAFVIFIWVTLLLLIAHSLYKEVDENMHSIQNVGSTHGSP